MENKAFVYIIFMVKIRQSGCSLVLLFSLISFLPESAAHRESLQLHGECPL